MNLLFWRAPKIPVLLLRGLIAPTPGAINIGAYTNPIDRAFAAAKRTKNLILAIESPGGSAVQSDLIGQLIRRRAEAHEITVTSVIGDVGASGGYWLACAGEKIYANRLSIVGSIGVITGGFGFDRLIARYDIQRRLYTAGENKARGESFSPERPQDVTFTKQLLSDAHEMFKSWVRDRRGTRLAAPDDAIFDGGYMLGEKAKTLGLIDGFGDIDTIVKDLGGPKARPEFFKPRRPRGLIRLLTQSSIESALNMAETKLQTPTLR